MTSDAESISLNNTLSLLMTQNFFHIMTQNSIHPDDEQMSKEEEAKSHRRAAQLVEGNAEKAASDVVVAGEINASGGDGQEQQVDQWLWQVHFSFHWHPHTLPVETQVQTDENQHGETGDAVKAVNPEGEFNAHVVQVMRNQNTGHQDKDKGEEQQAIDEGHSLSDTVPTAFGEVVVPILVPAVVKIEQQAEENRHDFMACVFDEPVVQENHKDQGHQDI